MKRFDRLILALVLMLVIPFSAEASSGASQLIAVAKDVAALELGFGDYILGGKLTEAQKKIAKRNDISKTLQGTYKFVDGDIFIVAKADDDMVLGIYKDYPVADRDDAKAMVGDLMMRFEEPTTMAHDKVIYWAFDKNGKISEDDYDFSKKTGETEMIATVKFKSTVPILPDPEKVVEGTEETAKTLPAKVDEADQERKMYVIISSTPMSKLFLAQTKQ